MKNKDLESMISCIICVYNGGNYIKEAVESILAQTYTNIEIIIVDDGSTDNTKNIVADYGDKVRYVYKKNGGHASACNLGIKEAKGKWICFLDHDDLWLPQKLDQQHKHFQEQSNLHLCVTMVQDFYHPDTSDHARSSLPGYVPGSLMAKRDIFEKIGFFDEDKKHTYKTEWFAKVRQHKLVDTLIPETLVLRRIHKSNLSFSNAAESHDEYLNLIKKLLDERRKQQKETS